MDRLEAIKKRFAREVLKLECEIITPMFLGDVRQKPALRPEPFKGLLRYWWRVATAGSVRNILDAENRIFGGAGGEDWGRSLVTVEVEGIPSVSDILPSVGYVYHPEVARKIDPLLYLGYGPILYNKETKRSMCNRSYLAPGNKFTIKLTVSSSLLKDDGISEYFKRALYYFRAFGTVGSRSRNGWGSFQVIRMTPSEVNPSKIISAQEFTENLFDQERDYPHTLAADTNGMFIWKIKKYSKRWEDVMKKFAETYINIRTSLPVDGSDDIDERHLLGFPITNHLASKAPNWGKNARHASPIRFFVRKKEDKYYGFILHLPFGISSLMRKNASGQEFFDPAKQFGIWGKVHGILDSSSSPYKRASINECL